MSKILDPGLSDEEYHSRYVQRFAERRVSALVGGRWRGWVELPGRYIDGPVRRFRLIAWFDAWNIARKVAAQRVEP